MSKQKHGCGLPRLSNLPKSISNIGSSRVGTVHVPNVQNIESSMPENVRSLGYTSAVLHRVVAKTNANPSRGWWERRRHDARGLGSMLVCVGATHTHWSNLFLGIGTKDAYAAARRIHQRDHGCAKKHGSNRDGTIGQGTTRTKGEGRSNSRFTSKDGAPRAKGWHLGA